MSSPRSRLFIRLAACVALAGSLQAESVPGTSDLWLAGMPNGSTASFGDVAPDQSPVPVLSISVVPGTKITWVARGIVDNTPNLPSTGSPDGSGFFNHASGAENGLSDVVAPLNSLIGVFLTDDAPNSSAAPSTLDFSAPGGTDYGLLSPGLKQIFFMGDGLDSFGNVQCIEVPAGATRMFLGTMDGFGWYNNSGSFDVTLSIKQSPVVPEASPWAASVATVGLAGLGVLRRRRA